MLMNKLNWIRLKKRRARFIVATADLSAKRDHTTMRFCLTLCPTSLVHPHHRSLQRVVAYPDFIVHPHHRSLRWGLDAHIKLNKRTQMNMAEIGLHYAEKRAVFYKTMVLWSCKTVGDNGYVY